MQFNHYGPIAARYAAALANAPATTVGYQAVIDRFVRPVVRVDPATVPAIAEWSSRLWAVFMDTRLERRVSMVNQLLEVAIRRPFVSTHDGLAPHLHYAEVDDDLLSRLRARTAAGLAHVLCDGDQHRLGNCAREGCDVVYMDTSRNGRRRFCTLRCANRVRVAEHRGRAQGTR